MEFLLQSDTAQETEAKTNTHVRLAIYVFHWPIYHITLHAVTVYVIMLY